MKRPFAAAQPSLPCSRQFFRSARRDDGPSARQREGERARTQALAHQAAARPSRLSLRRLNFTGTAPGLRLPVFRQTARNMAPSPSKTPSNGPCPARAWTSVRLNGLRCGSLRSNVAPKSYSATPSVGHPPQKDDLCTVAFVAIISGYSPCSGSKRGATSSGFNPRRQCRHTNGHRHQISNELHKFHSGLAHFWFVTVFPNSGRLKPATGLTDGYGYPSLLWLNPHLTIASAIWMVAGIGSITGTS